MTIKKAPNTITLLHKVNKLSHSHIVSLKTRRLEDCSLSKDGQAKAICS